VAILVVWVPLIDNPFVLVDLVWRFGSLFCSHSSPIENPSLFVSIMVVLCSSDSSSVSTLSFIAVFLWSGQVWFFSPYELLGFFATFLVWLHLNQYPVRTPSFSFLQRFLIRVAMFHMLQRLDFVFLVQCFFGCRFWDFSCSIVFVWLTFIFMSSVFSWVIIPACVKLI